MSDTTQTDTSLTAFLLALAIDAVIGAVVFTAFIILRCTLPDVYQPRWQSRINPAPATDYHEWKYSDPTVYPWMLRPPPRNPFRLLWRVMMYDDAELVAAAGVDAYMVIRVCRLGLLYFGLIAGIYGFGVLLPLNVISDEPVQGTLEEISIARVGQKSSYLWAHSVSIYVFSAGLVGLIIHAYSRYLPVRYAWLSVPQPASFTVLVVDLPTHVVDDVSLAKHVGELYPGQIDRVCMATRSEPLEGAFEAREKLAVAIDSERRAKARKREKKKGPEEAEPSASTHKCCGKNPLAGKLTRMQQLDLLTRRINQMRAFGSEKAAASFWSPKGQNGASGNGRVAPVLAGPGEPAGPAGNGQPEQQRSSTTKAPRGCCGLRKKDDKVEKMRDTLALAFSKDQFVLQEQAQHVWRAAAKHLLFNGTLSRKGIVAAAFSRALRKGVYRPTAAGFVTFNTLAAAQIAPQVQNAVPSATLRSNTIVLAAPQPRDIDWTNIEMSHAFREARKRTVILLIILITLFYTIPVAAISTLTSMEALSEAIPGLAGFMDKNPGVKAFVEGFLPTLVLRIFLAIMPMVTAALAKYGGARSISEKLVDSFRLYFIFQIWVVFLAFTFTGTAWEALDQLINSPTSAVEVLASSLPALATFFSAYIALQALVSLPLALLRPVAPIMWMLGGKATRGPQADRMRRETAAGGFALDTNLTSMAIIFVIGTTYSSINPVISPVCCIYFAVAAWVFKYQLLYVCFNRFESGGAFFPKLVNRLMIGLVIYQLVMIGILTLKQAAGPAALAIPAPFLTIMVWRYLNSYERRAQHLPIAATRKPGLMAFQTKPVVHRRKAGWCGGDIGHASRGDARVLAALTLMRWWLQRRAAKKALALISGTAGAAVPARTPNAAQLEEARALSDWRNGALSRNDVRQLAMFTSASSLREAKQARALLSESAAAAKTWAAGGANTRVLHPSQPAPAVVAAASATIVGVSAGGRSMEGASSESAHAQPHSPPGVRQQEQKEASRDSSASLAAVPLITTQSSYGASSPPPTDELPQDDPMQYVPQVVKDAMQSVYLHPAMRPEFDTIVPDEPDPTPLTSAPINSADKAPPDAIAGASSGASTNGSGPRRRSPRKRVAAAVPTVAASNDGGRALSSPGRRRATQAIVPRVQGAEDVEAARTSAQAGPDAKDGTRPRDEAPSPQRHRERARARRSTRNAQDIV